MPKKIYKELIEYICPNCLLNFGNKKSNLERHINRKKSCLKITPEITPNTPKISHFAPENISSCIEIKSINNEIEIENNEIETKNNNIEIKEENNKKFCCEFCNQYFSRKFCLDRHLNNNKCKMKLNQLKGGGNNNKLIQNDNKLIEIDNKLNLILKQNEELKLENEKLKKQIKKTKKTTNININQPNININQNNLLVNFNDLDYNNIDKKLFIQPILNFRLFGKSIILQMIENIYINENLPEYQNLIITDKNRGYVKIYNNGKWKTDNINIINMVIDGVISQSKNILIELKQNNNNNNQIKNRLNTSEKYINLCDLEKLNDLEDEQENEDVNNKNEIKRIKDFREMVFKDTINLFHDNKNLLLKQKNNKLIELDN